MRLFPNRSGHALVRLAQGCAALGAVAVIAGCGNNYRPVVTPVNSNGPAAQPVSWAVAVSAPSPSTAGQVTIIDYSGDSILVEAPIGIGPTTFTLDSQGSNGYTINSDGTITNFPLSTSLQQKQESTSTLPPTAQPLNMFAASNGVFINDLSGNQEDLFTNSPASFKLAVPLAPPPVFTTGPGSSAAREYVLSQNFTDATGLVCNLSPQTAPANGVATPIELNSDTADPVIPVGKCPVYAVQTSDQKRLLVMNRGDDTVTVINSQNNGLDSCTPFQNQNGQWVTCHPTLPLSLGAVSSINTACTLNNLTLPPCGGPPNGTAGMTNKAGPIYAEYSSANSQLVVADFDGGTISVIDLSTDEYGNDYNTYANPTCTAAGVTSYANCGAITGGFGTTYTIPVGNNPASVTVLADGTRAYTANQTDGTVSIVDLADHILEKTLAVVGHPRTVVSTENSLYGKVYAASPDSPFITILQTETDLVDTTILLEGNTVDVRTTTQNGNSGNNNYTSRVPGYGQPCNLPPALMVSTYGANYTLANCKALP